MCWVSNKKPKKQVSGGNVTVYKIVIPDNDEECYSLYENYPYFYGDQNKEISVLPKYESFFDHYRIERGYHSYSDKDTASKELKQTLKFGIINNRGKIVRCAIPKGSIYYRNEYNRVVSSNIIIYNDENVLL